MRRLCALMLAAGLALPVSAASPGRQLVLYCSHDTDACELAAQTFARESGIATTVTRKATGEYFAQLRAERDNSKADVWYGGAIVRSCKAPAEDSSRCIARRGWRSSRVGTSGNRRTGYRVRGDLSHHVAFSVNPAVLVKRGIAAPRCWSVSRPSIPTRSSSRIR
jgi:iron(III) transport system substrate-binding protein